MRSVDDKQPGEGPQKPRPSYVTWVWVLATAAFLLAQLPVLVVRVFDPDELQHSHAAWCAFRGMLPYRDFFEHHTPWYYYALSPLFHVFDVAGSFASARAFLLAARGMSLVLAAVAVLLLVVIGRRDDRRAGWLAGLLLASQPVFFQKMVEIRPDVLAVPLFLVGLGCLLRGLADRSLSARARLLSFSVAGLAVGAAIMCTQKMLFVLPGTLGALGLWTLIARRSEHAHAPALGRRVLLATAFGAGVGVPGALTWLAFAMQHGGKQFITNNFLLNSKWTHFAQEQLVRVIGGSWPVLVLALLGATVATYRYVRAPERDHGVLLLLCNTVALAAGILVVPVAHRQYYLMLIPIVCLFAARGLVFAVDRAPERTRARLLVAATLGLLVVPAINLADAFTEPNDQQLARLRYVFEHTRPTDVVLDGWEGTGVFRPHAFDHFFLHDEALVMLSQAQVDAYVDGLESGRIRPRLIALDGQLVSLGSRFVRFVRNNYATSDGFFYLRKSEMPANAQK